MWASGAFFVTRAKSNIKARRVYSAPVDTAHPYTRGLMQASPTMGMGRSLPHSIPGTVPDFRDRPAGCGFSNRCPRAQAICRAGPVVQQSLHPGHVVACHFPFLAADTTAQP